MQYITDIRERYIMARWLYLMGEHYLSDIEYDKDEREFKTMYPDDPYSNRPWSFDECPKELLRKYGREDLIIDTKSGYFAESIYSINTWTELKEKLGGLNKMSRLSFKIDGWNHKSSYYNQVQVGFDTRGRGGSSLNCTAIAGVAKKRIALKGRVAITGEVSIPMDKWKSYKLITGNSDQRASVRTAIANGDIDYLSFLAFDVTSVDETLIETDKYKILKELGFKTPLFKWVDSYDSLCAAIKYMSRLSKTYNYLVDGLVIENEDYQYAIRLGEWEEKSNSSYVIGYDEKQGMYGTSLVVLIKPVNINGRNISRIDTTNLAIITENNLQIGFPIAFNIRSAANNVLDVGETYRLQQEWRERYEDYRRMIDESQIQV